MTTPKQAFSPEEITEMIPAAKTATADDLSFWDRIAGYFDRVRSTAEEVVKPRKTRDY